MPNSIKKKRRGQAVRGSRPSRRFAAVGPFAAASGGSATTILHAKYSVFCPFELYMMLRVDSSKRREDIPLRGGGPPLSRSTEKQGRTPKRKATGVNPIEAALKYI